jgi:glucan biosynthesis protein C
VYLLHMPLTIGFGALLYGAPMPALAKITLNVAATTAVCLASYHLCVRFTAVSSLAERQAPCPSPAVGDAWLKPGRGRFEFA